MNVVLSGHHRIPYGFRVWTMRIVPLRGPLFEFLRGMARHRPWARSAAYEPRFYSLFHAFIWTPGRWLEAHCADCPGCPIEGGHRWGFYAFHDIEDLIRYVFDLTGRFLRPEQAQQFEDIYMVFGITYHAGRVMVGEKGLRSSHAMMAALLGPDEGAIYALNVRDAYTSYHPSLVEMAWRWEPPVVPSRYFGARFGALASALRPILQPIPSPQGESNGH